MISVVIPTIRGRDKLLDKTIAAFEATTPVDIEFIIPRELPTCGEAWNAGAEKATQEYLMLAADDLLPDAGWAEAAIAAADMGVYPAPWIVNLDGTTECCGTLGSGLLLDENARNGLPANSSPIPFLRRDRWADVGPALPAHYYADDWLGYRARFAGLSVEVRRAYRFTHLDGQTGHRALVARSSADRQLFAQEVSKL